MTERPTRLLMSPDQFHKMTTLLSENLAHIFLIESCRRFFARERWYAAGKPLHIHAGVAEGTMPGTIAHNRKELEQDVFGSAKRTGRLIGPLSALEPVYSFAPRLKALSIGPRTEMELLHLVGIGFQLDNIRAVDLISSSPLIDCGDMHDLPYRERAFDVVISGWAVAYSNRPDRAIAEMIRVCADGGLIAIGITFDSAHEEGIASAAQDERDIRGTNFSRVKDFERLIGNNLHRVLFQQDPDGSARGPVMIIAQIKHPA